VIVITDPHPEVRRQLADRVAQPDLTREVAGLAESQHVLEMDPDVAHIVVMGPSLGREETLRFAEKVEQGRGPVATLLVAETLEPQALREALRSGVDDVLTLDAADEEWLEAVKRAQARLATEGAARQSLPAGVDDAAEGRIVTVFSTKGGCGKSLVASNLAVLAAEKTTDRIALVDLNLQSGDLAIMLQLMPALSIYDAAESVKRLDVEAIQGYMTMHRCGVSLLAAPMEPSLAEQVSPQAVSRILDLLRATYPLTIIDGPAMFTEQLLAALDKSDQVVLVGSMDVPSIKNLRLAINTLQQLGHPREHLKLVLNRADSKVGLRPQEVEKSLGAEIDVQIPSSRDVPLSINQGMPLALHRGRSPVVTAIDELLPRLDVELVGATDRPGRRKRR
jgi:pilus assembly protein CpaE